VLVALLLVVALACLCVGLLLSSTPWLVASVAASVVAGLLIRRHQALLRTAGGQQAALLVPSAADPDVWVIDGRPRYHRRECEIIDGQDAEPVPLSQASEDGFIPCALCEPNS
jgi:hypothetical protein